MKSEQIYLVSELPKSQPIVQPGMTPSLELLKAWNLEALGDHRLSHLAYTVSAALYRLTFVFNNGIRSPPAGSY